MRFLRFALFASVITLFANGCGSSNNPSSTSQPANAQPSPAGTTSAPTPDEFASIRATYAAACVRCHRADGEGGVVELDEGETLKVPSFKKGHTLKHTDQEFVRQIANGGDGMPAFKSRLTPEQINGLVRFIRKEFQAGVTSADAPHASEPTEHK